MKRKCLMLISLVAVMLTVGTSIALASFDRLKPAATLAETVRQATTQFKDVQMAEAAGYKLLHGCVSGPQPEALLYEAKDGKLQLVGVEYVALSPVSELVAESCPTAC